MASSQVTKPVFPPEIWPPVFSNLRNYGDLVHLWTDCRRVCRQFKFDVERIFSIKHLNKTMITFDCGIWYNSEAFGGKVDLRSISFGFARFANDGETAIFKVENCAEEYMSEIMQRVSYCISTASIERPGQLVCFRGNVNDTDVPGLAVGKESREISFDWRAMFSRFCAEDKLKHYFYKNLLSDEGDGGIKAAKLKDKVDRGEADRSELMSALIEITVRSFDESRTSARRARIHRQWEAEGQNCVFDEGFKAEEEAALGAVKEMQLSANYFEYSDDEVEEEADSASRRKETTSEEEDDEDDEIAMYENLDDQDDVDDDDDMEEEDDENVV